MLRAARMERNVSQEELAHQVNISFRTYQRIEAGQISPRMEVLFRILNFLKIDAKTFILSSSLLWDAVPNPKTSYELRHDQVWQNKERSDPMLINSLEVEIIKKVLSNNYDRKVESMGYWEWNIDTHEFFWSPQMFAIYGMNESIPFDVDKFRNKINKADLIQIDKDLEILLKENGTYDNTHLVIDAKAPYKVRSIARKYENPQGNVVIFGIAERVD